MRSRVSLLIGYLIGLMEVESCFSGWRPETSGVHRDRCWVHLLIIYISDLVDNVVGTAASFAVDTYVMELCT